jgi:hypothetical protein
VSEHEFLRPDALIAQYDRELDINPRAAAETAYALAFRYRNHDVEGSRRFDLAKLWAFRAIGLLDELPANTVQDVTSTRQSVGGVPIPELLHAGVVKERLGDVLF